MDLKQYLKNNTYPGRGIICGVTPDGKNGVCAYFIMGRSENSRNRVFEKTEDGIKTTAYDPSKIIDPSLIIYHPIRIYGNKLIVTNGDQTDTIYDGLKKNISFEDSLQKRTFEPDAPNYTPRISALMEFCDNAVSFKMSILKSDNAINNHCLRYFYNYDIPNFGEGRIIHTYKEDGSPIPSFEGEPRSFLIESNDMDTLGKSIWNSLDNDNKVSLFVGFFDIETMENKYRIYNKLG